MAGHSHDQSGFGHDTPAGTAPPTGIPLDEAMDGMREDLKAALRAYRDSSAAQERLLERLSRIVAFATAEVDHG